MTSADCNTFCSNEFMCSLPNQKSNESFPFTQKLQFRVPIDFAPRLSHVLASVAAIFVAQAPPRRLRRASSVVPTPSRGLCRASSVENLSSECQSIPLRN